MSSPPPRLPLPVTPLSGETMAGYLHRLAIRNRLPPEALSAEVLDDADPIRQLSAFTGLPEHSLRHALSRLDLVCKSGSLTTSGTARVMRLCDVCAHCAAARGTHGALVAAAADRTVCRKHRRWIGGPGAPCPAGHQFGCAGASELFTAASRHHALSTQWGSQPTAVAFYDANGVFAYWRDHGILDHANDTGLRRRRTLLGWQPGHPATGAVIAACCHPGTVRLTAIILRLRHRIGCGAADPVTATAEAFQDVARHVLTGIEPGGAHDPLHDIATPVPWLAETNSVATESEPAAMVAPANRPPASAGTGGGR